MNKIYQDALNVLLKEVIVIIPTDTVMGIGCFLKFENSIEKLYKIKNRPAYKPTAVLVSNWKMAEDLMEENLDKKIKNKIKKIWPGALTIIVKAKNDIKSLILNKDNEIGIRMPAHKNLRELIDIGGYPLVASSANFSGEMTPVRISDVNLNLIKLVDFIIKEDSLGQKASTVIRINTDKIQVIRKGEVSIC